MHKVTSNNLKNEIILPFICFFLEKSCWKCLWLKKNVYLCSAIQKWRSKHIGIWCNGNTTDSGPVILGSSPSIPTQFRMYRGDTSGFFMPWKSVRACPYGWDRSGGGMVAVRWRTVVLTPDRSSYFHFYFLLLSAGLCSALSKMWRSAPVKSWTQDDGSSAEGVAGKSRDARFCVSQESKPN